MARPSRLNAVIDRIDGKDVTVRDRILTWLRGGLPFETTVLRANISPGTAQHWLRESSRIAERRLINPDAVLTEHEEDLLTFNDEVEQARAEGMARTYALLRSMAEGGMVREVVMETRVLVPDPKDSTKLVERVTERKVRRETALPSERALMWILERRWPEHFARHVVVDQSSRPDPLDPQERAELALGAIEDMLRDAASSTDPASRPL